MHVITHHMILKDGLEPEAFEGWVRQTLYPRMRAIKGIKTYSLTRLEVGGAPSREYLELSEVENAEKVMASTSTSDHAKLVKELQSKVKIASAWSGSLIQ